MYMFWTSLMLFVAFICDYTIYMLAFTCNCPRISIFSLSLSTLTLCWLLSDIIPSISAMEPLGQTADPVFTLGTRSGCDLRYSLAFKFEGSDTELKCVRDARIPESKNYGFPVKLWLSPDNSVKSGFQCWIPWIPSRFRLDSETSVRDSGVCRTPRSSYLEWRRWTQGLKGEESDRAYS